MLIQYVKMEKKKKKLFNHTCEVVLTIMTPNKAR